MMLIVKRYKELKPAKNKKKTQKKKHPKQIHKKKDQRNQKDKSSDFPPTSIQVRTRALHINYNALHTHSHVLTEQTEQKKTKNS
jgi:hypothetical protein